jgi:predicted RND superfamily exporter protein
MSRFTNAWSNLVVQYRWFIIATTLVLMALAPLSFDRLYYDSSNEAYFVENDPNLVAFDNLLSYFGDTEYLVLGVQAREQDKDVFNVETITMLDEITTFLEDHEHVTQIRSLSKYQYTHDDEGMLATDDLFEYVGELAENPDLLDKAREIMKGETLALESLITTDFQHTRIAARVEYIKNENYHNVKLVSDLLAFIEQEGYAGQGFNLRISGTPVIQERFETLTRQDQAILNPAMGIAMMIILAFVFRSIFATVVPLVVILSTMFFLTSLQGILSYPNTAVSSGLVGTMIILSMGTSVHVLVEFFQARRRGASPVEAARETNSDLFFAILFTSLTTAIGFLALSITELRPVRQFAILAAFGPMIIFLMSTTTLPAVLSFIPWLPRGGNLQEGKKLDGFLSTSLASFTRKNRIAISIVGLLITLFSLYSIQHIKVDSNTLNYFKESSWVNKDLKYFNDHFKGIANLEIIIDTGKDGGVKEPEILQRVDALQTWLESFDETGNAISVIDFYKQINQSLNGDNTEYFVLPNSRQMAAQFLLLYENTGPDEDLSDFKDFNEQFLRISVPTINMDETQTTKWLDKINSGIENDFSDLSLELTGSLVMNNAQNSYTNNGMFQSFGIAILVIGLSFLVLFRSIKYGVIALLPSIVPVILTGSLVSYVGIKMDLGTMIVGAMTIGIAVDDSIHVMSRYRLMRRQGKSVNDAIIHALQTSGRAVILTSIILIVGFSCMLAGHFMPFIYVGLFSAMIMLFALIGDLIFMPALLYLFDLKNEEQSIGLKTNEVIENA